MPLSDLRYQKKRRSIESMIEHVDSYKINPRFITRPWTFNYRDGIIRQSDLPLKKRLEIAAELVEYGLSGIEIMYSHEINEENLDFYQKFVQEYFLKIVSVVIDFSSDSTFDFGALASPIPKIRNYAIEQLKTALEINEELNTDYTLLLINADGYDVAFGMDLIAARDRFAIAVTEALEAVSEARIAFQIVQNRKHQRTLFHSTGDLALLCQKIESLITNSDLRERMFDGHTIITSVPDLKYVRQNREEPTSSLSIFLETARLAGICYNAYSNTISGGSDASTICDSSELQSALYTLKMAGFVEHICLLVDSNRVPPQQALKNIMDKFRAYITFVNYLDDDKIILSHANPTRNQGWLEAYLLRANSPHVQTLPPLDFFQV